MTYFQRFFQEKNLPEAVFTVETTKQVHVIMSSAVIEAIDAAPADEQAQIKSLLVQLDVASAPILPLLRHLAECMAQTYDNAPVKGYRSAS